MKATLNRSLRDITLFFCGLLFATASLADLYYIHADHLATPKILTDQDQKVVWRADSTPFGESTTNGKVTFNLRFPGQYYDQETGYHYNYYRYYDPDTGRYISSDPIGLRGGLNTYAYVDNNPLKFIDPEGNEKRTSGQRIIEVPEGRPLIEGQEPLARAPVVNWFIGLATLVAPELAASRFCPRFSGMVPKAASQKPIIVGENMKRVKEYLDKVGGHAYRPRKNDPFDFDLAMKRNERWIKDQMRNGREVIDIGPDFQRRAVTGRNSPFYEMKRRNVKGYDNYNKAFERSGNVGGVPGLDF
jgi:RHS repeat-associated protein